MPTTLSKRRKLFIEHLEGNRKGGFLWAPLTLPVYPLKCKSMIWYLAGWGGGIPFIQFPVADTVLLDLPFWDMDFTRCTATENSQQDSWEKTRVWQCPGKVPEAQAALLSCWAQQSMGRKLPRPAQAENGNIWSAESAGRPRLDQASAPSLPACTWA